MRGYNRHVLEARKISDSLEVITHDPNAPVPRRRVHAPSHSNDSVLCPKVDGVRHGCSATAEVV